VHSSPTSHHITASPRRRISDQTNLSPSANSPLAFVANVSPTVECQHLLLLLLLLLPPAASSQLPAPRHTTSMRPLRLLLSLSTSLVAVALLLYITLASQQDDQLEQLGHKSTSPKPGGFKALLSFTSPGSLFPPSAIISLTDDNSTFFLARPAAFGPTLPKDGLSSPLWIGSGFGDDTLGKGELGCGDSLDWDHHDNGPELATPALPLEHPQHKSKDPGMRVKAMHTTGATSANSADNLRTHSTSRAPTSAYSKKTTEHADIQSLQESAEIHGKVVLLKRGSCGFQQKVLWAQNRGAVAVIVGDNVRGGGLVRMYAQGDTSNVTIPSLFTSHTTAHLLSSLSTGGTINNLLPAKGANTDSNKSVLSGTDRAKDRNIPPSKVPLSSSRLLATQIPTPKPDKLDHDSSQSAAAKISHQGDGWVDSILSALNSYDKGADSPEAGIPSPPGNENVGTKPARTPTLNAFASTADKPAGNVLPGSGEYPRMARAYSERKAWWDRWFHSSEEHMSTHRAEHAHGKSVMSITNVNSQKVETPSDSSAPHEGLWVTLTPTNVSTSPFFDTLLVLVVSPLVTLTVVYALLLLRSRIRRRRWRAPKSLVERLPVRTYQTISDSTSSPTASASSPTTPLLSHSPPQTPSLTQSRRSSSEQTPATSSTTYRAVRTREEEKRESGLAEWRRRYGGRQKECVVCLEEYVDGISQVMSLPCGHEFHADCM
jgi:hypothetical protein